MLSKVNNNFSPALIKTFNHIFGYLSPSDLGNVASTSKGMYALSHSQRLKKAQKAIEDASKFQGIIQLPSFNTKSEDLSYFNTSICSIQQKIKSIPMFREIFVTNHGDFGQIAQEIRDRDLVIVLKQIAPPELQQQMEGLPNSQAAAITRNWLKKLDPQDGFFQKKHLVIQNSHLTSIPPEIFTYFPKLQILDLSNNDIQVIPPEIGQLPNLLKLDLKNNQIQVIPPETGLLSNLRELNLENNQLQVIPPEIGQLPNLLKLNLKNNHPQVILPEINQLQDLQLNLENNQLQVIPPEINQLQNLQWGFFDKEQNLISRIRQLSMFQELDLKSNQIRSIPSEIEKMMNFRGL